MKHLSAAEVEIFASQIRFARVNNMPHPIANPDWTSIGWAKMGESVLGKYHHGKRTIELNESMRNVPEFLVSTLCHELHHQWQHETMGWRYWLACSFLTRDFILERSAREVENAVDGYMNMSGLRDGDD
jgi:hypothetical protein